MPKGGKGITRKAIPCEIKGQAVLAVELLGVRRQGRKILLRCGCGRERWCDIHQVKDACYKCSAAKRAKRLNPGTVVGNFEVISFAGVRPYSRGVHVYEVRDRRCGHVNLMSYRAYAESNGFKQLCGCPTRHKLMSSGYVKWCWEMPDGRKISVPEHRIIMERELGRELYPDENVHHINGVRDDNRPENLELWSSSQPSGQRVADKLAWAKEMIERYG